MPKPRRMTEIADHFNREAAKFDDRVVKIVPDYREMLAALVGSLDFPAKKNIHVLDLGCGTGTIALAVKQRFPRASVHCVDLVPNMLQLAAYKLHRYSGVTFEQADFHRYAISRRYHAVVTSLALHHLETDADKMKMHRKIFRALLPGGVFASADITVSPRKNLQQLYLGKWAQFVRRSFSEAALAENYRRYQREDRPSILRRELGWLERIGFRHVEVLWKYYNFAVYAAYKSPAHSNT
ncbi:MAG: methyltransferase domain-containing protein [candidate division FCPU426 bacterium]